MSRTKPGGLPARLGDLLAGTKSFTARAGRIALDRDSWARLVGERIASRSSPSSLVKGVLWIETASAVWAQELSMLTAEILPRLRAHGLAVNDLRFKVATSTLRETSHTQRARRDAPKPVLEPLPSDLALKLHSLVDPELAALIGDTAARTLARQKQERRGPQSTLRQPNAPTPQAAEKGTSPRDRIAPVQHGASRRSRGEPAD